MASIPEILEVARPLIERATWEGFEQGERHGKTVFLDELKKALDHGADMRKWYVANRVLVDAEQVRYEQRAAQDRARLVQMRERHEAGTFDPLAQS